VPTTEFHNEQVHSMKNIEKSDKSDVDNFSSSEQQVGNNIGLLKDNKENNVEEDIVPHPVSPSYESVYDGTILPFENDNEVPPPSIYSTKIIQNDINMDEQVQLNVYPNLISSTFPVLSDIFSSTNSDVEDSEKEDIEDSGKEDVKDSEKEDIEDSEKEDIEDSEKEDIEDSVKEDIEDSEKKDIEDSEKENVEDSGKKGFEDSDIKDIEDSDIKDIENSEEEDIEDSEKENAVDITFDKQILEIEKADESSLNSKEKLSVLSEDLILDDNIEGISDDKFLIQTVIETDNNNKTDALTKSEDTEINYLSVISENDNTEDKIKISEKDNIRNETKFSEQDNLLNEIEASEKNSLEEQSKFSSKKTLEEESETSNNYFSKIENNISEIGISKEESKISEENNIIERSKDIEESEIYEKDSVIKIAKQFESKEINITEEKLKNNIEEIHSYNSVNNVEDVIQSSSSEHVSTDSSSIMEKTKSVYENLQNDIVPKPNEIGIIDNSVSTENYTSAVAYEKMLLDDQKVLNNTSVNSVSIINSTISEVPLKNDNEESVTVSIELSLSSDKPFHQNVFENEIENKDNVEADVNLTINDVFVESDSLNNLLNLEKQLKINDNIIDSNNNVVNNYDINEPIDLHNNSDVDNGKSSFQIVDSSYKHVVNIPSTSSFGEFLGNRNLLNAKKGF
jgi:hypothetical protein